jgi:hypothetical protein
MVSPPPLASSGPTAPLLALSSIADKTLRNPEEPDRRGRVAPIRPSGDGERSGGEVDGDWGNEDVPAAFAHAATVSTADVKKPVLLLCGMLNAHGAD